MAVTLEQLREYVRIPEADLSDELLQQYLDFAELIVSEDMANCVMTDEREDAVTLNLAAHFASLTQGPSGTFAGLTSLKVGSSEERYATLSDSVYGLATTHYGQLAVMLDPCGILTGISSPKLKAKFRVV